jgi:hypothetical protein
MYVMTGWRVLVEYRTWCLVVKEGGEESDNGIASEGNGIPH